MPPFIDIADAEYDELQNLTLEELEDRLNRGHLENERIDVGPTRRQQLGWFTVFCLVINRTIASGIFTQPVNVLRSAGSGGAALLIWVAAGFIVLCIVASWMELALTIPIHYIQRRRGDPNSWERMSAPRNGGDKNYLEYIYKWPRDLMKCVFGITFIVWGNLAGNALQLGVFMQRAINPTCREGDECFKRGYVVAWGVAALSSCALLNVASRKYTMGLNNAFAVAKLAFVIAITFIGIVYGSVHGDGCRRITWDPIDKRDAGNFGDISLALFFAMYPYTGYEQPFYVLAEVSHPQKTFASATFSAMVSVLILFPLANLSYLCMTPYTGNVNLPENMALAFIERLSGASPNTPAGDHDPSAVRGVSALLAVFIFGNLMAQTYTASRVKQEVAKEGILPCSLFLATGNDTLFSRIGSRFSSSPRPAINDFDNHREQAPFAATALHWFFEIVVLMSIGLAMEPSKAYGGLTYTYTFIIVGVLCLFTAGGLLYLKMEDRILGEQSRKWSEKSTWQPWLDPLPAVVATVSLLFLLLAAFAKPTEGKEIGWPWWVGPTVGWVSVLLGVSWWCGLQAVQWVGRWELRTERVPVVEIKNGEAVQKAEVVTHTKVLVEGGVKKRRRQIV